MALRKIAALVVCIAFIPAVHAAAQQGGPAGPVMTAQDVVRAALAQHPLVDAAQARLRAAEGARRTAGTLGNPTATYWVENAMFPGQRRGAGFDKESSAYLTMPLEPLLQRGARIQRADQDITAAGADLAAARRQVALDAARVFYRLANAASAVQATRDSRTALERLLAQTRARLSQGATPEVEAIRVEVELARSATEEALADVELARARAELAPYIGGAAVMATPALPTEASGAARRGPPLPGRDEMIRRAIETRPELAAARARVAAANAEISVQRTMTTFRQIGATFGMKRLNGMNSMIVGVAVPVPLFDRNRGEVQRVTGESLAVKQELAWAERQVRADVESAYAAAERLSVQARQLQSSLVQRAAEAQRITLAAYAEGAATLLQVLDASRASSDARLTYSRVVLSERQALFELALAIGTDPEQTPDITADGATASATTRQTGEVR
jgi:cobalt-zinc-cadmium efflux system outer membrane protein